jgi:formylglycine-generating enzyme required for sulfatase activity
VEVEGGTFYRAYSEVKLHPATVSAFRLDKYEVTVGRFREFVNAWHGGSGWLPPPGSGKHAHLNGGKGLTNVSGDAGAPYETGWVASDDSNIAPTDSNLAPISDPPGRPAFFTWTSTAGCQENLPITYVNWWEAYAFCIWDGGFLPSQAEWEFAAAGGSQQRQYPWGSMPPGASNQYAIYGCYYGATGAGACTGVVDIAPVGTATLGAGRWDQLDLAGNVLEWNLNLYGNDIDPCVDCALLPPGIPVLPGPPSSMRDARGGDFATMWPQDLHPYYANGIEPWNREGGLGFRCARAP